MLAYRNWTICLLFSEKTHKFGGQLFVNPDGQQNIVWLNQKFFPSVLFVENIEHCDSQISYLLYLYRQYSI
ncbi:DUF1972 domain-containing protein [Enterocloster bolteae]|uniref:Uncharacterized protein n=1 Tax=Enterocloster bolteae TaxID=208479 RepID=A0A412YSW2_9FIRM|nr:hypothetical protein DWY91_27335 [Enterocloster bolteae]RGS02225.1 hypothetical protein DWY12_28805 [Enterocloster bolteae]RGV68402.1 hypothetical protein DWW02_29175 [Enterocloster bolteae]